MQLPQNIQDFITHKIELTNLYLPQNYPTIETFEEFQKGYKYNEIASESFADIKSIHFKKSWYVICSNYFDDPYYIDLSEQDQNFPVYFSYHGADKWIPIKVAENIDDFTNKLLKLQKVEHDKDQLTKLLKNEFDLTVELWQEIYESDDDTDDELPVINIDPSEWILGKVVISAVGENKITVINFLKGRLNLTPQQALALTRQDEIEVDKGYLVHLKDLLAYLRELGATAEFIADKIK